MKNIIIYIIIFFCHNVYSQTKNIQFDKKEEYKVINDYLQTIIKDKFEEVIIIEDKISPNEVLRIFKGNIIKDNLGNFVELDGGVEKPLFKEKYFQIMDKKYHTDSFGKRKEFTNEFWKKEDFKHNKIILENFEDVYLKLQKGNYFAKQPEIQILALSDPIYYQNKNYLVIGVFPAKTKSAGFSTSYIVVMKKIKEKWVVVNKTIDYVMN